MYRGDYSRKQKLVDFGFRLPSALDNRPLKPEEFTKVTGQTVYVSATPAQLELEKSSLVVEQLIRPTGLLDPEMEIRPIKGQVEDCISEIKKLAQSGYRALVTTLTKRMTEDLTDFLREREIKVEYLHSDIDAIERVELLRNLRTGAFDACWGQPSEGRIGFARSGPRRGSRRGQGRFSAERNQFDSNRRKSGSA